MTYVLNKWNTYVLTYWQNSFDRVGWKSADLLIGFDKDREIKQEQEHGIEGQNSETDESSNDEDSKMKSYITR